MLYIIDVIKYIYYNINPSSTIIYITSTRQAHISALKSVMYIDLSSTHFNTYVCDVHRPIKHAFQHLSLRCTKTYQAHTSTLISVVFRDSPSNHFHHVIL